MPLTLASDAPTYHAHFEAKHVTQYIEEYVNRPLVNGRSLRDYTVFGLTVTKVEKHDEIWDVEGSFADQTVQNYRAPKLIVATGLTSEPQMPLLPNQEKFGGVIVHQKCFGRCAALSLPTVHSIVVIGGAKSAADMVYLSAKAGKAVSWFIRDSGNGPGAFTSPKGRGRYENSHEKSSTRHAGTLSPSPYLSNNFWTWFLHKTRLGRWLLDRHWRQGDVSYEKDANYHGRKGALEGFEDLDPQAR